MCREGGGVGDRLESSVKTHSIFAVFFFFFLQVVLLFLYGWGGRGKLLK